MENNEILVNEDVIETTEEIMTDSSNKGLIVAGVACALVVGAIVYKKLIKPAIAKRKAKKQGEVIELSEDDLYWGEESIEETDNQ